MKTQRELGRIDGALTGTFILTIVVIGDIFFGKTITFITTLAVLLLLGARLESWIAANITNRVAKTLNKLPKKMKVRVEVYR